jgi:drug/metabolite transporter superfamily protein YnfA
MARRLHQISTYLLIALGVVHTSLTPFFNEGFSVEAMYFASAGLAMIVVGFLNIAMSRNKSSDRMIAILCYIANVLFAVFGLLTAQVLGEPQAYFGLVLILTMTVTSFLVRMRKNEAD